MPIYDVDAILRFTGMEVEADSEEEAEEIVIEALEELISDYVPLDASGTMAEVVGITDLDDDSYSRRSKDVPRDSKGRFTSSKPRNVPARSSSVKSKKPQNRKGVRR